MKGQRVKMGVKGPKKMDVIHSMTMPLAAGKKEQFHNDVKNKKSENILKNFQKKFYPSKSTLEGN